jgi:DNA mismatch repair protein MutS
MIDAATRANLELMRTLAGERRGSLADTIDRTVTAAGARLLSQRLAAPLTDPAEIARRLDAVARFATDAAARADVRSQLAAAPDLARALARIVLGRGGPRDLAAIRDGLDAAAALSARLGALGELPEELGAAASALAAPDGAIAAALRAALADELPYMKRDGGFVAAGYDTALDDTRGLRDESRRVVAALQARYADETGVRALKVRHNNVLGYFVEVTAQHGEKLFAPPLNGTSSTARPSPDRCASPPTELAALEAKIASAADRALAMELEIFERLAGAGDAGCRTDQARRARRSPCSTSRPRSPRSRSSVTMCGPRSTAHSIS